MSIPNPDEARLPAAPNNGLPHRPNDRRRAILLPAPQSGPRGGGPIDPDEARSWATPGDQPPHRSNDRRAKESPSPDAPARGGEVEQQQGQSRNDTHALAALLLFDPVLQTLADGLNDIEATRIAQGNRLRILTRTEADEDGERRGFGLPETHPAVAALQAQLMTLQFLDEQMSKALAKQLRSHPLYGWIKAQKGLGDKTVARLLGAIHDPYWNELHDRPRTVGELFAYCGVAGPDQRRQRGAKTSWNPDARTRLWIMTDPIIRGNGPYREVYTEAREFYADKTHTAPCAQCGTKGHPAEVGSAWRDGHKHAGARRKIMRAILRDLWTQARDYHEGAVR